MLFFGSTSAALDHAFAHQATPSPGFATLYQGGVATWDRPWPSLRSQ